MSNRRRGRTADPAPGAVAARAATGMSWVTVGALTANAASYGLHLLAGRWLHPAGYGEFATLLTVQLVLAVPALALQTVIARAVARGRTGGLALAARIAVLVAVLAAAAWPVLTVAVQVGAAPTAAALLVAPLLVLLAGVQGRWQGAERFGLLAAVLAAAGIGKVVPAVAVLALGGGVTTTLVASAVGTAAVTAAALARIRREDRAGAADGAARAGDVGARGEVGAVLRASQVQLVIIVLSSIDLIMAKALLTDDQAGLYAMGAIATKVAFWLPQAVGVVLYPRMARADQSRAAVRLTLAVLAGLGAVTVAAFAAGAPLLPVLVGGDYRPVTGWLWLFALTGALLAVLQGGLLSAIARERTGLALIAWAGLAVEVAVLSAADTVPAMIVSAAACVAVTTGAVTVAALRAAPPTEAALLR